MHQKSEMWELLVLMAEYHKEDASPARIEMFEEDLKTFDVNDIKRAWAAYRKDARNKFMPTPALLIDHIQDGRPTAQEAWGIIPKDEASSVVWSEEMRLAFGDAYPHLVDGSSSAAFFAFRDSYDKKVREARYAKIQPSWSQSFGYNRPGRVAAVAEAIAKGRIDASIAQKMLPEGFSGADILKLPDKLKKALQPSNYGLKPGSSS